MQNNIIRKRTWAYPLSYFILVFISILPLYTDKPYLPENTQDVLISLFKIAGDPFIIYAPLFHAATFVMVILIVFIPEKMGRVAAGYMGINYLVIAITQTMGQTQEYGFVLHTGGVIVYVLLGIVWLSVAYKRDLLIPKIELKIYHYGFILLALLAFWAPYKVIDETVLPHFDPILLLTSSDFGMSYCFTTPIFLLLLILVYPGVNAFAYRITAFNGFIYGLFNLTHWFNEDTQWMGVLHLPLLVISIYALLLVRNKDKN